MTGLARVPVVTGKVWTYVGRVTNVVDGDTADVELYADTGFDDTDVKRRRIRILRIDAPDSDKPAAKAEATAYARATWLAAAVVVDVVKYDKYGGRHDGNIRTLDGTIDWASDMLAHRQADPYGGGHR